MRPQHLISLPGFILLASALALAEIAAPEDPPEFAPAENPEPERQPAPPGAPSENVETAEELSTDVNRSEKSAESGEEKERRGQGIPPPELHAPSHDDVRLLASVDNSRPTIGDWVTYRLRAEGPEGIEFKRAELPTKMPDYVALKGRAASDPKNENGQVSKTWEFLIDFFFTGKFPLPPILVTYKGKDGQEKQLLAPVFFCDVQNLPLDPQNPSDIRPNKPMKSIPVSYRRAYGIAGVALGLLALLGFGIPLFLRWWRRAEEMPPIPAHLIAYEQMRRLVQDQLVEQGRIEEYYVRLSDICRHYLENRFGLKAPERTTEEFFLEMAQTRLLADAHKDLVKDFLGHCDLVKFARYGPTPSEMRLAFESAKRLVDETRERDEQGEGSDQLSAVSAQSEALR